MVRKWGYKDPEETKVFSFGWTKHLNDGAIVQGTNTWSATPAGLTITNESIVTGGFTTSAKIASGADGTDYVVTNRVTTSDGETLEESGRLRVRQSTTVI